MDFKKFICSSAVLEYRFRYLSFTWVFYFFCKFLPHNISQGKYCFFYSTGFIFSFSDRYFFMKITIYWTLPVQLKLYRPMSKFCTFCWWYLPTLCFKKLKLCCNFGKSSESERWSGGNMLRAKTARVWNLHTYLNTYLITKEVQVLQRHYPTDHLWGYRQVQTILKILS